MGWLICLTAMAFFGCVCMLWTLSGWFFAPDGQGMLFCDGNRGLQENRTLRRFLLLRDLGLIRWTLNVVDLDLREPERKWLRSRCAGVRLWTKEEYLGYLETERKRIDGTGNGYYTGRDQRCGIRKL